MPRIRRTFTDNFKKQMVQLYENGKSRADIVSEYELSASALDRWIKQAHQTGSFSEKDNQKKMNLLHYGKKTNGSKWRMTF
ncbi:transposase [Paenibacillus sp. cl6col]|nr:transposase [Paenibacillus sp. cl6col]